MRRLPTVLLYILLQVQAQDSGAFVAAPTGPSIRMFDPANPPIPLRPGEAAITRFEPLARAGHPQTAFDGVTLTVVRIESPYVGANILVFLPYNVTPNIREHEDGHARLCRYEYAKAAQRVANGAWAGFVGMRFAGRGATPAQRQADALAQIQAEGHRRTAQCAYDIGLEVAKLNDIYDNLTQHGNNPAIDTARGEAMAKQQFEAAVPSAPSIQVRQPGAVSPAQPRRSRNKLIAFAGIGLGGLLLVYGALSYARR